MTDPRFDPRFQRGYDGPQPAPSGAAAPSPARAVAPSAEVASPRVRSAPPLQHVPTPSPVPVAEPLRIAETSASAPVDPRAAPVADDDGFEPWEPPRRNPFSIALLILSVLMVAVGGWLLQTYASIVNNGYNAEEQLLSIIQQQVSPALIVGGILGIIAWLVLGALASISAKARD